MAKGFKTINLADESYTSLSELTEAVRVKEGLSKLSLATMIERMMKLYKDTNEV